MKIGVLGTGEVGRALGKAFLALGHDVKMGAREAGNAKSAAWAAEMGPKASHGTFADATAFGEIVVLATLGMANESCLRAAGPERFRGKLVIDATNPLDVGSGTPPKLAAGESGGELVQRLLPDARVVKAFNTVGNAHMFRPDFPGGPPDMFICGNDEEAKKRVTALLGEFGWNTIDVGGIGASHYLEAMCIVWVLAGVRGRTWNQAFKLLRK
ncbi:MAG TPA: NAD(P)-binding domain-containing protein [Haliangiales bacterium]|nr:NAD(P)-binding domain-containing protein [Haliangiales bacterium]